MSATAIYDGGIEAPRPVRLTTTNQTDILTAATDDNFSIVASFSLANETAGAVLVSIHFYDGTTNFLWFSRSVPANDTVIVTDIPMRLRGGNKFKATAATGNAITVCPIVSRAHRNAPINR